MTAKDARNLTAQARDATHGVIAGVVADIHRRIAEAARQGQNSIYITESLMRLPYHMRAIVTDALKKEGYEVESHSDQREGDWTNVSW